MDHQSSTAAATPIPTNSSGLFAIDDEDQLQEQEQRQVSIMSRNQQDREVLPLLSSSSSIYKQQVHPPPLPTTTTTTTRYAYFVTFSAAVSGLLFGYDIGIIDSILKMPSFMLYFSTGILSSNGEVIESNTRDAIDGDIVSSFLAGCVGGAMSVSVLADSIGRKRSILLGAIFFTIGGIAQALSVSIAILCAARVISGVSIGILSAVTPLYLSEIAPADQRGRMVAIQQLMITIGILTASIVNAGMYVGIDSRDDSQWRGALGAQGVLGAALLVSVIGLPYSPRWLMGQKGREEEAADVITRLRIGEKNSVLWDNKTENGKGGKYHPLVQAELDEIREEIEAEVGLSSLSWKELMWTSVPLRRRVFLAIGLQAFQQLTGINAILYFAADLFARIGLDRSSSATTLVVVNSLLLIIGTIPGLIWVETKGRRPLLVYGAMAMCISHIAVCGFITLADSYPTTAYAAVAAIFTFTFCFSATWGPVVWCVQSEILPLRARAKGSAIATVTNWALNAVIGKVTPLITTAIEQYTYSLFAGFCLLMCFYSYASVPETKGVSLEAMETVFQSHTALSRHSQVVARKINMSSGSSGSSGSGGGCKDDNDSGGGTIGSHRNRSHADGNGNASNYDDHDEEDDKLQSAATPVLLHHDRV